MLVEILSYTHCFTVQASECSQRRDLAVLWSVCLFAWAPHSLQRMSSHTEMRRRRIRCWEDSVELFGRGLNLESWHVGVFTPRLARRPLLVKGVTAGTLGIPESLYSSCHPHTFYICHWFPLVHPTSHHHHLLLLPTPCRDN